MTGFFANILGFFNQPDTPTKGQNAELKHVQELMTNDYHMSAHDFSAEPHATWGLVLELVQYRWLSREKRHELAFMREEDLMKANFASPAKAAGIDDFSETPGQDTVGCLKPSEHEGDYEVNRDLIRHILDKTHNQALQRYLQLQCQPAPNKIQH